MLLVRMRAATTKHDNNAGTNLSCASASTRLICSPAIRCLHTKAITLNEKVKIRARISRTSLSWAEFIHKKRQQLASTSGQDKRKKIKQHKISLRLSIEKQEYRIIERASEQEDTNELLQLNSPKNLRVLICCRCQRRSQQADSDHKQCCSKKLN